MSIFNVFTLFGGLAMFLFGMNVMGEALEKQAGGKLKHILEKITSSPVKGLLLGAAVTCVIQSSSATTVMVVGFVNSGLMQLNQAIGIIMGANIGTTITAWIISLTAIQSDNIIMQCLKPSTFAPVLAAIGIVYYMFLKSDKKKNIGLILLGFAVLMSGMQTMSGAVEPLAEVEGFRKLFVLFTNPILGVLVGAFVTAIIQSSSASVGILQALSVTGSITYACAIPIILGQNIGTCATALLASVGTGKNARRASMVHLYFNIIGAVTFLIIFYGLNAVIGFSFINDPVNAASIAVVHSVFNVFSTLLLLPFTKQLEKLACLTIKDDAEDEEFQMLDERLFTTPTIAVYRCQSVTKNMADTALDAVKKSLGLILNGFDEKIGEEIVELEDKTDVYEDKVSSYIVKLNEMNLSVDDSRETGMLLHCIGDFERIGDHARNIKEAAEEMHDKNISFSATGKKEIDIISDAVGEILSMAVEAFKNDDIALARKVEPLEQVVDILKETIRNKHISRLQRGICSTETGFVLSDIITNYERIADHCSNIALCLIETEKNSFSTHEYVEELRNSHDAQFEALFDSYKKKYSI